MNYTRFNKRALMVLVFLCFPAAAMDLRPAASRSFFGRCYSSASSWVSSSFLVTRDFLKRELASVRTQLFGFNSQINELHATTSRTELNLAALVTAQNTHKRVAATRFENILQRVKDTNKAAEKLRDQQIQFNEEFKVVHTTTIASQNSVALELNKLVQLKKEVADHKKNSDELESTVHKNLKADKQAVQLQLHTISENVNQAIPLVKVLSERVKKFEQVIATIEEESKQLICDGNKNSRNLEKLDTCVKENRNKTLTLCNAIKNFEDTYYSKLGKQKPVLHMEGVD